MSAPTKYDLCKVSHHAGRLSNDCHAAYWMECGSGSESHLREPAKEALERIAELFGARLVWDDKT